MQPSTNAPENGDLKDGSSLLPLQRFIPDEGKRFALDQPRHSERDQRGGFKAEHRAKVSEEIGSMEQPEQRDQKNGDENHNSADAVNAIATQFFRSLLALFGRLCEQPEA